MSWLVCYTRAAREDLKRWYGCLLGRDVTAAERALTAIVKAVELARSEKAASPTTA